MKSERAANMTRCEETGMSLYLDLLGMRFEATIALVPELPWRPLSTFCTKS